MATISETNGMENILGIIQKESTEGRRSKGTLLASKRKTWELQRIWPASRSQVPVDSATRGKKRTPCWAQSLVVLRYEAFLAAYWEVAARADTASCPTTSYRCGVVMAKSSAAGEPWRFGKYMSVGRRCSAPASSGRCGRRRPACSLSGWSPALSAHLQMALHTAV